MDEPNPVKAAREWAGYESANQAAIALKLDQSQYNKIERGVLKPGRKLILKLVQGFGCRSDHILGLEPLPAAKPKRTKAAS